MLILPVKWAITRPQLFKMSLPDQPSPYYCLNTSRKSKDAKRFKVYL